jgi:hypothetical protein
MSSVDRQTRLLQTEDWTKIYRSFQNADFQSYDFENIRRVMVDYIRQNYPEDFNDFIENSEYVALIDAIAFLGQSISFRVDLNARENFLDTAERRDSILRLSRLVGYNAKRNIAASGLLKITGIKSTERVVDGNGRNLADQYISWNDPSNVNWYDQFHRILNAALPTNGKFGTPIDSKLIYGIPTEQYRFQSANAGLPIYNFNKTVAGRTMGFEVTSTTFKNSDTIYEEAPKAGKQLAFVFKNDSQGYSSANTGFFLNFTEGSLNHGTFTITQPRTNELVNLDIQGINESDVWVYQTDSNGYASVLWEKVPSVEGNNIIYNSVTSRNIYSVLTRANDSVTLAFGDGNFGTLPVGSFSMYYRVSNGLIYSIDPQDFKTTTVAFPYMSNIGNLETMTLTLSLSYSVSNSAPAESNASIKSNAPATFYTQNRMITGEDYNISPLGVNQHILKVKSINRTASGISRYFDLTDPTGKYSSTSLYGEDGIIYREDASSMLSFAYKSKTEIEGIIYNKIVPLLKKSGVKQYFYAKYVKSVSSSLNATWNLSKIDVNTSIGTISNDKLIPYKVGNNYTTTELKYCSIGSLLKFNAPQGKQFNTLNNNALEITSNNKGCVNEIWATIINIVDDGTTIKNNKGPIVLNEVIPHTALLTEIIPKFKTSLTNTAITSLIELIYANKPFGLSYNDQTAVWEIISETNLNVLQPFSTQRNYSNTYKDSSWLILFLTDNNTYTITTRETRFVFESDQQLSFYFDNKNKVFDIKSNTTIKDTIAVLSVNTQANSTNAYTIDHVWHIADAYVGIDGYVDSKKVVIEFADTDNNGIVDDPDLFNNLVSQTMYIVEGKYSLAAGQEDYKYVPNNNTVIILQNETLLGSLNDYTDNQYFYFIDANVVKKLNKNTSILSPSLDYKVYSGRDNLKFHYVHNANYESRIDPGTSNIIDIFVLTRAYDMSFRQWSSGIINTKPVEPTSAELYNMIAPTLNPIKPISDEVIYHSVSYELLFGSKAKSELQATFKVTKTTGKVVSDDDIKARVITAINRFFALENWDFGETFYFTELATYVIYQLQTDIVNFVIVPNQQNLYFGNLFEIPCSNHQLFVSCATVNDIEIISGITPSNIKAGLPQN